MLQKYKEIDFEFNFVDKSRHSFLKRINSQKNLSTLFLQLPLLGKFFFIFSNIVHVDTFPINRFFLLFWLFSGCFGSVQRYKIDYRLGIYYYHFVLVYKVKKKAFFNLLSFFLNDFLRYHKAKRNKKNGNNLILFFDNLELFTNYKLARGVYFGRIQQKLFFIIYLGNCPLATKNLFLSIFLYQIKLHSYVT